MNLKGDPKMRKYTTMLGEMAAAVAPATTAALAPAKTNASLATHPTMLAMNKEKFQKQGIPALIAAAVAYYYFKKHRVLAAIAGAAVGYTAMPLVKGEDRKENLELLGEAALATAGAMYYKKRPAIGWVAGAVAGGAAIAYANKKM